MILPCLEASDARALVQRAGGGGGEASPSFEIGSGDRLLGSDAMTKLRDDLSALAVDLDGSGHGNTVGLRFDASAAEILHRSLDLRNREAADLGFWRFVACAELYDIVCWRHGGATDEPPHESNFGIGSRWECLPQRLWFRAELAYDGSLQDPYELSRRGGSDFWQSGVVRVLHGCSRPIVRALVRFQFPEPGEFLASGGYRPQTLKFEEGVRVLYKRLRQLHATTSLLSLTDEEADVAVESLARGLPRQDRTA